MSPLVSIIIVYYKGRKDLIRCLGSLKRSKTRKTHEVIVINNSRDSKIINLLEKDFPGEAKVAVVQDGTMQYMKPI